MSTARLIESDIGGHIFEFQRYFIRHNVNKMLSKLYGKIWALEEALRQPANAIMDEIQTWVRYLCRHNQEPYVVGPMGERPIHICASAIAKHRGRGESQFADGILDGMIDFVNSIEPNRAASLLCEPYGKDYCAAVGCFLSTKTPSERQVEDFQNLDELPYLRQIQMWLKKHDNTKTTSLGMHEAETVHFALIACGDRRAVEWLIAKDCERNQIATAHGHDEEWSRVRFGA